MNPLTIPMPSQRKLNTDGVESRWDYLPGVGSFLANPGLSKEQLVPSCMVRTFMVTDVFIGILAQHLQRCVVSAFIVTGVFIGILAQRLRHCVVAIFK